MVLRPRSAIAVVGTVTVTVTGHRGTYLIRMPGPYWSARAARPASRRATGTRKGEQET